MTKKLPGVIAPILLIIIGLIVGIGVSIVFFQFKSKTAPQPQSTPINRSVQTPPAMSPQQSPYETTNWKTYTNSDYTIKYPSDLSLTESTEKTLPGSNTVTLKNDASLQNNFIIINTWVNNQNKTLQQFITDYSNGIYTKDNTSTYQVNNVKWLGYIDRVGKTVFIAERGKVYIFSLSKNPPYDSKTSDTLNKTAENIFNQILSTFKFLN